MCLSVCNVYQHIDVCGKCGKMLADTSETIFVSAPPVRRAPPSYAIRFYVAGMSSYVLRMYVCVFMRCDGVRNASHIRAMTAQVHVQCIHWGAARALCNCAQVEVNVASAPRVGRVASHVRHTNGERFYRFVYYNK